MIFHLKARRAVAELCRAIMSMFLSLATSASERACQTLLLSPMMEVLTRFNVEIQDVFPFQSVALYVLIVESSRKAQMSCPRISDVSCAGYLSTYIFF